jgi:hypothetical protein
MGMKNTAVDVLPTLKMNLPINATEPTAESPIAAA